ncbi:MAG: DUF3078 domain-containing protein [Paludibacteraceae bacterium]|nr:DUF3078 domain-containing protein [Paludibacteraceae bacterium]
MSWLLVSSVFAGDTIYVLSDTYAGVAPDTFKLQDQRSAVDNDQLLLQLVAQQSRELYVRDSIRQDSLLTNLRVRDSVLQAELAVLQDSIRLLEESLRRYQPDTTQELASAEVVEVDSLQMEIDSVMHALAEKIYINQAVVEKSIFRDLNADLEDVARALRDKYSHWYKEANLMVQFTQNYISPNWYKGGNSQFAVLNIAKGQIGYRRDRITWENTGEWRVGVTTTPGDTLRKYNVTDDMFRLYSKFGYQIVPKLYAVASVEFNTTLWNVWNENQSTVKTAFMTPLKFYIYGGLDYRPIKDLSILVAPVTYKLVYAYFGDGDSIHNVNVTNYGIEAGKQLRSDFGSTIRVQWQWRPVREFGLDTEFYFFTNYRDVEIDWEINGEFYINRFLSIRLMLHPRFDSAYIAEGDTKPKMQFKELLSVGFSHKFR